MRNGISAIVDIAGSDGIDIVEDSPTLGETTAANMAYKYNPIIDFARNRIKYGVDPEEGYKAVDNIPEGYESFGSTLLYATNNNHMADLIGQIDANFNNRKVMDQSGFVLNTLSEFVDPINYIPIVGASSKVVKSAVIVGASTAAVQTAAEVIRLPFDPLGTVEEAAVSIGAATVFGSLLGSAVSIPIARRVKAINAAADEFDTRLESLAGLTADDVKKMGSREQRAYAALDDETLNAVRADLASKENSEVAIRSIDLERTLRRSEAIDAGKIPEATIAKSLFTDSFIYKGITTPMKRLLQNEKVPDAVKFIAQGIAGDSGILLKAHQYGVKIGNSVFQSSKLLEGEWVREYDTLINLWGKSTEKGVISPLDYNVSNSFEKVKSTVGLKSDTFEAWLTGVDQKYIRQDKNLTDIEAQAVQVFDRFYTQWETRLNETGLIGSKGSYEKLIERRTRDIDKAQSRLATARNGDYIRRLESNLVKYRAELADAQTMVEELSSRGKILPANEGVFRPRYWDRKAIKKNRAGFEAVLTEWFTNNPNTIIRNKSGIFEKVDLSTNESAISGRVNKMIDDLLGLSDVLDVDAGYFGMGKSKHMKHRVVDIPNELVLDFIEKNPVKVMKAYVSRVGPRYEFAKKFGGKSYEDVVDDIYDEVLSNGGTQEEAFAAIKDITALYDRVVGTALRNPNSWDQKIAAGMRNAAQLNYLGSAGFSTMTEPAKIIMEHGLGPTMRGLFSVMEDSKLKMGARESRIGGEALENLNGSAQMRLVDDVTNNPFEANVWDKAKDAFYLLNLLGPITRLLKDFDGMMRSHTLIDYSVRWANGKATKMEQEYLLRYNIDFDDAVKISSAPWQQSKSGLYMANTDAWVNAVEFPATMANVVVGDTGKRVGGKYSPAFFRASDGPNGTIYIDEDYISFTFDNKPWTNPKVKGVNALPDNAFKTPQEYVTFVKMHEIMHTIYPSKKLNIDKRTTQGKADYENAINDLAMAEIKKQNKVDVSTRDTFRTALSSGVMNTILMGTPADKPIITDGIVYIPMRVAGQFGMKEDSKVKGYARIENGLLGLPFQFYSYSLAAVNKISAAYAHNQVKGRYSGALAGMGLGYMLLEMKTPDWVMEEMSFSDKFARSFDYSGLGVLYSDFLYTGMATSMALGGPNITGGAINPKFPQEKNYVDAATGIAGAGTSVTADLAMGVHETLTGNVGEGMKEIIRNAPFARLWFLKDEVNQYTRGLGRF
jgi:hypothetical protein